MCVFADFDLLTDAGKFERKMAKRRRIRGDRHVGRVFPESIARNANRVIARGNSVKLKFTFIVGDGFAFPIGLLPLQRNMGARDWAMLRIVNDAANRAKNAGECRTDGAESHEQQANATATAKNGWALHVRDVLPRNGFAARRAGRLKRMTIEPRPGRGREKAKVQSIQSARDFGGGAGGATRAEIRVTTGASEAGENGASAVEMDRGISRKTGAWPAACSIG